jgi:lipopolysaccharide/colanic/teichoic acid biosynthesis glycosyltransferase
MPVDTPEREPADRYDSIKSPRDLLLASLLLIIFSPFILLALIVVRLTSRGPVIYTQQRLGLDGKPFTILKIRTMYRDSELDGPTWSRPGDPRVTPFGRFLRWSHADELPQLLNVLRGEMSMIGPRPERPEIIDRLEGTFPRYRDRLAVRPGLTGLSQVLQRPDTDLESVRRKLSYDLYYVESKTPWLDFRIGVATMLLFLGLPGWMMAGLMGFPHHSFLTKAEAAS